MAIISRTKKIAISMRNKLSCSYCFKSINKLSPISISSNGYYIGNNKSNEYIFAKFSNFNSPLLKVTHLFKSDRDNKIPYGNHVRLRLRDAPYLSIPVGYVKKAVYMCVCDNCGSFKNVRIENGFAREHRIFYFNNR